MQLSSFVNIRRCVSIICAISISLLFGQSSVKAAETADLSVLGKWKIAAALDSAEIASLDENEAQRLVGYIFTINKENFVFEKLDCGSPSFEAQRVEPGLFLRDQFHASAEKLKLPKGVTAVDLNCTTVFIKNRNRLVIFWDGWFFEAVRLPATKEKQVR